MDISKQQDVYEEKKPIEKHIVLILYALVGILFLLTVLTKIPFFLFLFVTAFSSIVNYQTNMQTIRFNPDPEVFAAFLLTRVTSFGWALFFLFVPTLLVDLYTARLDKDTFISIFVTAAMCFLMSVIGANFVVLGIILVTIRFIVMLGVGLMLDVAPHEILFEHVLGFFVNVVMFLSFGAFFYGLFN